MGHAGCHHEFMAAVLHASDSVDVLLTLHNNTMVRESILHLRFNAIEPHAVETRSKLFLTSG